MVPLVTSYPLSGFDLFYAVLGQGSWVDPRRDCLESHKKVPRIGGTAIPASLEIKCCICISRASQQDIKDVLVDPKICCIRNL
jgi:hypothetical protein